MPAVVLPLRDPLMNPDPSVLVTLPGRDGPVQRWIHPDSGAPHVTVPTPWLADIGGNFHGRRIGPRLQLLDGSSESTTAGVLSWLQLGGVLVSDVPVLVAGRAPAHPPLLGQTILTHSRWEIDWDKGTLTLGAEPWPDAADVISIPLRRAWWGGDLMTAQVEGHAIEMVLDTGADRSVIGLDVAERASLAVRGAEIAADATLGPVRLGRWHFRSGPAVRADDAVVGLDVLGSYRLQVVPGRELRLRARGDAWESASARIARWTWARGCAPSGCVRGHFEGPDQGARLLLSFELDHADPLGILLGCKEGEATGATVVSWSRMFGAGQKVLVERLLVMVAAAKKGSTLEIPLPAERWYSQLATRCPALSALDVVPVRAELLHGKAYSMDPHL
jgi:hypothetical protein